MSEDVWQWQIDSIQGMIDDLEARIPTAEPATRVALEAQLAGQQRGLAWVQERAKLYRGNKEEE